MKALAVLFVVIFAGCSDGSPGPIDLGPIDIGSVDAPGAEGVDTIRRSLPPDVVPVFLDCEWGCPGGPILIRLIDTSADRVDADQPAEDSGADSLADPDSLAVADPEPDAAIDCDQDWEFSACCGDGTCQRGESAFFCPEDC